MNECALATRAASSISIWFALGRPRRMFSLMEVANRAGSWLTRPICSLSHLSFSVLMSWPSSRTCPVHEQMWILEIWIRSDLEGYEEHKKQRNQSKKEKRKKIELVSAEISITGGGIVEPLDKRHYRALAWAATTDQSNGFPGRDGEGEVVEDSHVGPWRVWKIHVPQFDESRHSIHLQTRFFVPVDARFVIDYAEDLCSCNSSLCKCAHT